MSPVGPRIGAHLSVGKGLKHTADEAVRLGLEAVQIFVRNPRGSGARQLGEAEVQYFRHTLAEHDIAPLVVHIPYTVNPAAVREDLYEFAEDVIVQDLERCQLLGADFLVLHPGTYTSSLPEEAVDRVGRLLNRALEASAGSAIILLETMAGQGTELGSNFAGLHQIISLVERQDRIGVCFDTCHAFASGQQWSEPDSMKELLAAIDRTIGREKIKLVHANDSEREAGSRRDRHAHIGQGEIGAEGFRALMGEGSFRSRAFIIETPFEGIEADIKLLKELRAL